jgi:hypothetical protein
MFFFLSVRLFLGTLDISDSSRMIFESDGNFQSGTDHTFLAAFPSTVSLPPSDDYMYLTLVMKTDLYVATFVLQNIVQMPPRGRLFLRF